MTASTLRDERDKLLDRIDQAEIAADAAARLADYGEALHQQAIIADLRRRLREVE